MLADDSHLKLHLRKTLHLKRSPLLLLPFRSAITEEECSSDTELYFRYGK